MNTSLSDSLELSNRESLRESPDKEEALSVEADSSVQAMFIDDPIVAHQAVAKQQKFLIEDIFRSQMKLTSDTVAKEFMFIMEFFDLEQSQ